MPLSSTLTAIEAIRAPILDDLDATNQLIRQQLASDIPLIAQISTHLIESGGKRIRPLVVLLAARACGIESTQHHALAAIIEFIHAATLLHDDVVDRSLMRRGIETAHTVWGEHASVLVGDFMYSRSFQMMVELNEPDVMRVLSQTTNQIAEGEVLQLTHQGNCEMTEADYFAVIERKTAVLFAAATELSAVVAGSTPETRQALHTFGNTFGMLYQLVDDVLDYEGSETDIGKQIGDDLAEGKPTLPLIYLLQQGTADTQSKVRHALQARERDAVTTLLPLLHETGAIDYAKAHAKRTENQANQALSCLPDSPYKEALQALVTFAASRKQ